MAPTTPSTYYVVYVDPVTQCESLATVEVAIDNDLCCDLSGVNGGALIRACEIASDKIDPSIAENVANGDLDGDGMDGSSIATVTYFTSQLDAIGDVNPIDSIDISAVNQVYARVSLALGCFEVFSIGLELFNPPVVSGLSLIHI